MIPSAKNSGAPLWQQYAAPKGAFNLTSGLRDRLNTFFADTRGEVAGIRKTAESVISSTSPLIREDGKVLDYGSAQQAVLAAANVAIGQYAAANGLKDGQAFWPQETHFVNIDGKDFIAAQFKDNIWGRQSKEVVTLVDAQTNKVVAMKTDGEWFTAPFINLPSKV